VVIFDECHRSQFGDMHEEITRSFKRYHLFGFTGTPIFADNAGTGGNPKLRTTEQAFGDKLHTYTIVDAINDKNVLPFRIDYINTIKTAPNVRDKQVSAIDTERRCSRRSASRRSQPTSASTSTRKPSAAPATGMAASGSTASIRCSPRRRSTPPNATTRSSPASRRTSTGAAAEDRADLQLAANEDVDGLLEEEFETEGLDQGSRDFLDAAIQDYNDLFATNFDTSADKFQNYYKDLSQRLKNRELDLVIVVNMFLTGFDATTLNTLWVDKNLRAHGLIQAYSRTNRILNSVKTYGNIVSFRNLEDATNDALALFGNKDAKGIVLLKPYGDYYAEYQKKVAELVALFPLGKAITGEAAQKRSSNCSARSFGCGTSSRPSTTSRATKFSATAIFRITRACISTSMPSSAARPRPRRKRSTMTWCSRSNSSSRSRSTSITS
jgi:type I restriction enzyme R subunit